jgi:hypothetical protein
VGFGTIGARGAPPHPIPRTPTPKNRRVVHCSRNTNARYTFRHVRYSQTQTGNSPCRSNSTRFDARSLKLENAPANVSIDGANPLLQGAPSSSVALLRERIARHSRAEASLARRRGVLSCRHVYPGSS